MSRNTAFTDEVLADTDVPIWWGHVAHHEVSDEVVDKVHQRVLEGMGLIVLHSGHFSKIFRKLMGTTCDLKWREAERGEGRGFGWLNRGIPLPKASVSTSNCPILKCTASALTSLYRIPGVYQLVCRRKFSAAAAAITRGRGKVFYFRPGHETFPIFYNKDIQRVLTNAVRWAAPVEAPVPKFGHHPQPLEKLER